ncbi:MAG TPA: cytochrome c [Chitinophagaceae bacterium]|jgi:mono/diheme cytochrome c family protein|nr:cytochrome c [Chitinophagaceae bacterium]
MKKLSIIASITAGILLLNSCSDVKRKPNRVYMPDMAYSVAVETYSDHSRLADSGIFYNARPVEGTVKWNEEVHYELLKDTTGSYDPSASMKNPLGALDKAQMVEAERLFLVNCGICHGQKLDGNGPLYKDGAGPYPAKPANLSGSDPKYASMAEGTMFHSITYGKGSMGSYASQVSPKQRWMLVSYIKAKQAGAATPAPAGAAPAAGKDSAAAGAKPMAAK